MPVARKHRGRIVAAVVPAGAVLALLAQMLLNAAGAGTAATRPDPTAPGPHRVATAEYTLGDTAFRQDGFTVELTGAVHYPTDVAAGSHPLVVISHGLFATCADRAAGRAHDAAVEALFGRNRIEDPAERERQQKILDEAGAELNRWPCARGVEPVPNHRGYDYLARQLASHGFVVLSVSANGINAGSSTGGDDFPVRAALVNKHLAMWRQLVRSGTGPLAGKLDGGFTGHVDLTRVGTLGHSRGGRGVVYHGADAHRAEWPAGVRVKAVVALEPVISGRGDDYLITKVPFVTVIGSCDLVSNDAARDYFEDAAEANTAPVRLFLVHGANHNFFNTQWSPSSGQVTAHDDAFQQATPPFPAPGRCRTTDAAQVEEKQLTEEQQRRLGLGYLSAFFRRHLAGEQAFDEMLAGREHPLAGVGQVDVEVG